MNNRITVKNVKITAGHDGPVWQCSVYIDGKKIPGTCIEDARGGGAYFELPHPKTDGPCPVMDECAGCIETLNEIAAELDPELADCKYSPGWWVPVTQLVYKALDEKEMKKRTVKEVWFSLEGEDSRTVRTYKRREKVSSDRCKEDECRIIDNIENVALREGKAIVSIQGIRKAHDRLAQVQMQPEAEGSIA